jgi:hypothetical protein
VRWKDWCACLLASLGPIFRVASSAVLRPFQLLQKDLATFGTFPSGKKRGEEFAAVPQFLGGDPQLVTLFSVELS